MQVQDLKYERSRVFILETLKTRFRCAFSVGIQCRFSASAASSQLSRDAFIVRLVQDGHFQFPFYHQVEYFPDIAFLHDDLVHPACWARDIQKKFVTKTNCALSCCVVFVFVVVLYCKTYILFKMFGYLQMSRNIQLGDNV